LRRGEIPVAYTEGFHPHIKISFGQPLPLGYTSDAEYFDLQLSQPFREDIIMRMKKAFPYGLEIMGFKQFFANVSSLSKQLNLARYEIPPISGIVYDTEIISDLLAGKNLIIKRIKNETEIEINVGSFIDDIRSIGEKLQIDVYQMPDGHVKPEEILIFGLGIKSELIKSLHIHRKNQFYKSGMRLIEPLDLV
jgi:radical SAM-linked protein